MTGGYFYYGDRLPKLDGSYIYGDYMTGKIWALKHDGKQMTWHRELADTRLQIISFALEPDGEMIVVGFDGTLHRLIPNPATRTSASFPRKLSETGLFASTADHRPAAGVVPYRINAHHWADQTSSQMLLGLPDDSQVSVQPADNWEVGQNKGDVSFPQDAVLAKTITLEMQVGQPSSRRRIETQILHRDGDSWSAYNYIWNEEQTDAVLQDDVGADREFQVIDAASPGGVRRQIWHHASRTECLLCHIWRAGTVHGFKLAQLNRSIDARPDSSNQLESLYRHGIFLDAVKPPADRQPSPYDSAVDLDQRARAWLHLNCAHCHRRGGGGTAAFDIQQQLSLSDTSLLDARVTQGSFGIREPSIVVPGDPHRSVLYYRISTLGRGHMPKFGSSLADAAGIQLMRRWIDSLPAADGAPNHVELNAGNHRQLALLTRGEQSESALSHLLSSTSGALLLSSALNERRLSQETTAFVLRRAATHTDSQIRDLFERFLPPNQRIARLGATFDVPALLAKRGDSDRGSELFFHAAGVTCRKCHSIDSQGGKIGPDLSRIGRQLRPAEILDNILTPSKKIDPQYAHWLVATTRGTMNAGLLIRQSDKEVVVRDVEGKDQAIAREHIALMEQQPKSLMPQLLLQDLTAAQAADLMAFLQSRKGDPAWGRKSHTISRTARPVRIDGQLDEPAWKQASAVGPFEFTWWNEGDGARQPTQAKLLWNDEYLFVAFHCIDTDIQATRAERDSQVYRDDCVEVFASPFVNEPQRYFNLEINAVGVQLDQFRPDGERPETPWNPDGIRIATSRTGSLNDERDIDASWTVEVAFPFAALGETLVRPPRAGDKWRLNLHRLENDMRVKSQWSRGDRNRSSFHTPQYFGLVTFGAAP